MTYEKFENTVLGMLLASEDPRLILLRKQVDYLEVLVREETEMGFTIRFLAPSPIAISEPAAHIFGVEAKFSDDEIINLELVIKDGLIERLKGTFTSELTYANVILRANELHFSYKNGNSPEVTFHTTNHDTEDVTFIENSSSVSKEIVPPFPTEEQVNIIEENVDNLTDVLVDTNEDLEELILEIIDETNNFTVEKIDEVEITEDIIEANPVKSGPFAEPQVNYDEVCYGKALQSPSKSTFEENKEAEIIIEEVSNQELPELTETDQSGRGTGVLSSIPDEDVDTAVNLLISRNSAKRKDLIIVILMTIITIVIFALILWMSFS